MTRSRLTAILVAAMLVAVHGGAPVQAQGVSPLAGRWTLSRELSQFPRELGFGMDLVPGGGSGQSPTGAGRRRDSDGSDRWRSERLCVGAREPG